MPEKRSLFEKNISKNNSNKDFQKIKPDAEICVDVTKGCALLINSKYFKEVNCFSEKFFLFWEEIDLCIKFLGKKLSIIVNPFSIAQHKQGRSSKFNLTNFCIRTYHNEISPLYYFDVKKFSTPLQKYGKIFI